MAYTQQGRPNVAWARPALRIGLYESGCHESRFAGTQLRHAMTLDSKPHGNGEAAVTGSEHDRIDTSGTFRTTR